MMRTQPNPLSNTLTPELFQQIKQIQLRTQHLVTEVLAGEYASAFKGQGMEFEHVREYQPGDDIRRIDWNVTARLGVPYVKIHRDERELTVVLAVDMSASNAFGSGKKFKKEVAAEVAAVLAYTAVRSNDRVGLVLFTDRIEHFIPPKKGRAHIWRVIREILTFRAKEKGTSIGRAMEYLGKVLNRRAVVFLISDFLGDDYQSALKVAARRHDVTAVSVTDPRESEISDIGLVEFEDAETGRHRLVDTSNESTRETLARLADKRQKAKTQFFRTSGIGEINIQADGSFIEPIVRFFRAKERRRLRRSR